MEGLQIEDLRVTVRDGAAQAELKIGRVTIGRGKQASYECTRPAGEAWVRAIAGLDDETTGTILVDGHQAQGRDVHQRKIAVVPEGGGLLPQLDVHDNILYGVGPGQATESVLSKEVLPGLAHRLQLTPALARRPHQLVTRELRLRVGLARAAISEPVVIVVHLALAPENPKGLRDILAAAVLDHAKPPAVLVLSENPAVLEVVPEADGTGP